MYKKFFAAALALSFAVTGSFIGWQQLQLNKRNAESEIIYEDTSGYEIPEEQGEQIGQDTEEPEESIEVSAVEEPAEITDKPAEPAAGEETQPEEEVPAEDVPAAVPELPSGKKFDTVIAPEFIDIDTSYFEDALFVGDSRMVGIKEYGGLKEPTYFASTGLSTFKLYKEELDVKGVGTTDFEKLISSRSFGKVYIMLGINEAGCKLSEYKSQYDKIIADVKEKQPDAILFLCSNLHVTKYKSEHDKTFANSHIDEINGVVEALAAKYGGYYLDVNPLFDDGEGNLSTDYAADYAHMYGKCYLTWIDWLCTKGVSVNKDINEKAY